MSDSNTGTKANAPISNATPNPTLQTNVKKRAYIRCNIRRKIGLEGIPGQNPAEKIYKIGSSLDSRTRSSLKGITGELEALLMPEIVGLSTTDPQFRRAIEEYWSGIGVAVPPDEDFQKTYERGVKLNIEVTILGESRFERFNKIVSIEEKMTLLNTWLIQETISNEKVARLDYESVSDYLLLNYCLKYGKVANKAEDIYLSPKIIFYIYEREKAIASKLSNIDLRHKAVACYQELVNTPKKLNSVLLKFGKVLSDYETENDKLLAIDDLYNESTNNLEAFVNFCSTSTWEISYLLNLGVSLSKIRKPANTTMYYYNDVLLGNDEEDAIAFLNTEEGTMIKKLLTGELKQSL